MKQKQPKTFFNTDSDPLNGSLKPGSLKEAVSKQLAAKQQTRNQEKPTPEKPTEYLLESDSGQQGFLLYQHIYGKPQGPQNEGHQLNTVDGQTGSGIEHLLPNPETRYNVSCQRLEQEISALKAKILDFERLLQAAPSGQQVGIKQSIQALKTRLLVSERRFYKHSISLAQVEQQNHPIKTGLLRPWLQIKMMTENTLNSLLPGMMNQSTWFNVFESQKSIEKKAAALKLKTAKDLLEAESKKPTQNSETLSTLIFQYEKALKQYQSLLNSK